jgi:hypothetical protein
MYTGLVIRNAETQQLTLADRMFVCEQDARTYVSTVYAASLGTDLTDGTRLEVEAWDDQQRSCQITRVCVNDVVYNNYMTLGLSTYTMKETTRTLYETIELISVPDGIGDIQLMVYVPSLATDEENAAVTAALTERAENEQLQQVLNDIRTTVASSKRTARFPSVF